MSGAEPEGDETDKAAPVPEEIITLDLVDFRPPASQNLSEDDRNVIVESSVGRIRAGMEEAGVDMVDKAQVAEVGNFWTSLIIRMITRVAEPPKEESSEEPEGGKEEAAVQPFMFERQEKQRQALLTYIMTDFPARYGWHPLRKIDGLISASRIHLASAWMNEEWYNDRIRSEADPSWVSENALLSLQCGVNDTVQKPNYDTWLGQITASYQALLDSKDKAFPKFLTDLPHVPADVLELLRELCVDRDRFVSCHCLHAFQTTEHCLGITECLLASIASETSLHQGLRFARRPSLSCWT
jgi:symplekin